MPTRSVDGTAIAVISRRYARLSLAEIPETFKH
jgi:hypothetical protein